MVNGQKYFVLWEISVTMKHLIKKASPTLLNKTDYKVLEAEQKMYYASFRCVGVLRYMTVSEMMETMH